jgi:hypothetical protein
MKIDRSTGTQAFFSSKESLEMQTNAKKKDTVRCMYSQCVIARTRKRRNSRPDLDIGRQLETHAWRVGKEGGRPMPAGHNGQSLLIMHQMLDRVDD